MKTNAQWVVAIAALGLATQAGAQAEQTRSFGDGTLPEHLAIYDVDEDGVLSIEEIQTMKEARETRRDQWRNRWDTNEDGVIDEQEREAAREALRQRIEERRGERFNDADTDGDGCLSLAEFMAIPAVADLAERMPEAPARIHARLDANDDGCLSLEEFLVHLRHRHEHMWRNAETFAQADGDDDGQLNLREFSEIPQVKRLAEDPQRGFRALDRDRDHWLSLEEFVGQESHNGPNPPTPQGDGEGQGPGGGQD